MTSDHPRACGANEVLEPCVARKYGSSPRMRGKLGKSINIIRGDRIIPAHAGQTISASGSRRPAADHPRACGANLTLLTIWTAVFGSSPRMRGKLKDASKQANMVRIIPAHAGQTRYHVGYGSLHSDHPRACGANSSVSLPIAYSVGSSPRMRGKRLGELAYCGWCRIIPAHAGQTPRRSHQRGETTDHPRACGANCSTVTISPRTLGSSPRMRGKRIDIVASASGVRIIPAHAGQTNCW